MPKQSKDEDNDRNYLDSITMEPKYYKSIIAGLSIQIGDEPERNQQPTFVKFTPYEFFDEERGDRYIVGYLQTEEPDAIEVLSEDPNVTEITEKEYQDIVENGKLAKA